MNFKNELQTIGKKAKQAAKNLNICSAEQKNNCLLGGSYPVSGMVRKTVARDSIHFIGGQC